MSNLFKEIAAKTLTLSELMNGRTKIETRSLVNKTLTITNFDLVNSGDRPYYICTFSEYPQNFYNCGKVLANMFDKFVEEYDGDIAQASCDLEKSGGVKIILSESKTRSGNNITRVELAF